MSQLQDVRVDDHLRRPDAVQTLDYTLAMLRGLAKMAAGVGLDDMARDLAQISRAHGKTAKAPDRSH